jgi:hypothetical protein
LRTSVARPVMRLLALSGHAIHAAPSLLGALPNILNFPANRRSWISPFQFGTSTGMLSAKALPEAVWQSVQLQV